MSPSTEQPLGGMNPECGWGLKQQGYRNYDPDNFGGPESIIEQSYTLGFPATNNEAKYKVVIVGLRMAATLGVTGLEVCCNLLLVMSQVNREYATKDECMAAYLQIVLNLKSKFPPLRLQTSLPVRKQPR